MRFQVTAVRCFHQSIVGHLPVDGQRLAVTFALTVPLLLSAAVISPYPLVV